MKLIKGILVWFGMIFMAVTAPIWWLLKYDMIVEIDRKGRHF
jgi:hypothetical protein